MEKDARTDLWLDLLRRLGRARASWGVHGNLDEAFEGSGDLDLLVPTDEWPALQEEVESWAGRRRLPRPVACGHRPGVLVLVTATRDGELLKLEVLGYKFFRGALLFDVISLQPLLQDDDRGFRVLRPGAAGFIKIVPNGVLPGGRPKWSGAKYRRSVELVTMDPEGALEVACLWGPAKPFADRAIQGLVHNEWHRSSFALLEIWAALRGFARPRMLIQRARHRGARRCTILEGPPSNAPDEIERWLATAAMQHGDPGAGRRPTDNGIGGT